MPGAALDIVLHRGIGDVEIAFQRGEGSGAHLSYRAAAGVWSLRRLDGTACGSLLSVGADVRILLDVASIEVLLTNGTSVMTASLPLAETENTT